ncbi:MAG: reverse transcriptase domain-containing protein [Desulfococcaceae bacterium]
MIFEKLYARETLEAAWRHVRSKRARAGVDRVEPVDFEKNIEKNLDALQEEIRSETYRPGPVMAYEIRRGGNPRNIGISTVRDRVAQQAAVSVLSPVFEPHFLPCSFAYRAKKSATRAAAAAADHIAKGRHWVLQTDVSRFFDSIDHDILMGILETSVPEKPVLRLIRRMLKAKIFREMGLFDTTIGSHQGSGLSPLLSNVYMQSVDRAMWKRFSSGYLRYSDDIALFCGERETLDEGLRLA